MPADRDSRLGQIMLDAVAAKKITVEEMVMFLQMFDLMVKRLPITRDQRKLLQSLWGGAD